MNATKVITDLCAIIDRQNEIIQDQAMELAQLGAMAREEEIAELRQRYADTIGAPSAGEV